MSDSIGTPILSVNRYTDLMPRDNIGMSIGSRIKEARRAAKLTQKELAKKVGMAQASLSELETGESQSTTLVASLAAALGVSALWLETGKGYMGEGVASNSAPDVLDLVPGAMRVRIAERGDPALTHIKKVKIKVQAGITGFQVEPEHYEGETHALKTSWVEREGFHPADLLATIVKGDSMVPNLHDGDTIIVHTRDTKPVSGKVYVINYEGEVVVKRLMRDAGQWWLTSDNPDQVRYHKQLCKGAECIIIGRVVRKESTHI